MKFYKKVVLVVLVLVWALGGVWIYFLWQPHEETLSPIVPVLRLIDFGHISPKLPEKCKKWAYGYDWHQLSARQAVERWNGNRGNLFLIEMTDSVQRTNEKIYEAWKNHKNDEIS